MIVFRVKQLPTVGDKFTYDGREYRLIEEPTKWSQYLYGAEAHYTFPGGTMKKIFDFEII